jgi:hypothetical protein
VSPTPTVRTDAPTWLVWVGTFAALAFLNIGIPALAEVATWTLG